MSGRSAIGAALAVAALTLLGLTAPSVVAADQGSGGITASPLPVSPTADAATRAIAEKQPDDIQVMATLCGTGYNLSYAEQLPDSRRFGTLFTYVKDSPRGVDACAVFDNNMGMSQWMKLKLCTNRTSPTCDTDEGSFSQYAGPVYAQGMCTKVTAIMRDTKSSPAYIDRVLTVPPCD